LDTIVRLVSDDLNALWFMAHARGWCPYEQSACPAVSDPLVDLYRTRAGAELVPLPVVKLWWEAAVERCATQDGGSRGRYDPDFLPIDQELQPLFAAEFARLWWGTNLGPRTALTFYEWEGGPTGRHAYREWLDATAVRAIVIVGTESAVIRRGRMAIVGALASHSQTLLSLLRNSG
jgi:hypothetical protein